MNNMQEAHASIAYDTEMPSFPLLPRQFGFAMHQHRSPARRSTPSRYRRALAATAVVCWLGLVAGWTCCAAEHPHVLLIYTDDQGYGDACCLNPESKVPTPNLDRLASEGLLFTDAHTSDTVCTPSRYGLLTGRYSWRTELKSGVFGAERPCLIDDERLTVASLLRQHGYRTGMVGKWHLGMDFPGVRGRRDWSQPIRDMPLDKGFDTFYGIPASLNYGILAWFEGRFAAVPPEQFTSKKPNSLAIDDYRIAPPYNSTTTTLDLPDRWGNVRGPIEVAADFVDAECLTRFTDRSIDWIRDWHAGPHAASPFFLYLAYTSPHKPVIPIEAFRGKSGAGSYGDFLMETDWHIGRLLDLLDELHLADNTLVIMTSDNGPETTWKKRLDRYGHRSNGIYREGKRSVYEGGHRVPFLVRWPARVAAGTRCNTPICQTDVVATLADILAAPLPDDAAEDSVSFYPAMTSTTPRPPRGPLIHHGAQGRFAIRSGDWKLVMPHRAATTELYNLATDPAEAHDVAKQHAAVVAKLTDELTTIVTQGRSTAGPPQPNDQPWWDDLTWIDPPREGSR